MHDFVHFADLWEDPKRLCRNTLAAELGHELHSLPSSRPCRQLADPVPETRSTCGIAKDRPSFDVARSLTLDQSDGNINRNRSACFRIRVEHISRKRRECTIRSMSLRLRAFQFTRLRPIQHCTRPRQPQSCPSLLALNFHIERDRLPPTDKSPLHSRSGTQPAGKP